MHRHAKRLGPAIAALALFLVAAGAPADLHLALKSSVPARDATVSAAPAKVELHFTQAPQLSATAIMVHSDAGGEVAVSKTAAAEGDATVVAATFTKPVAPGKYHVMWRAMAQDGHVIDGSYSFTFKAAADD